MSVAPSTARRPPGPRGKPVLGSILDFRSDILRALLDGWHEYGDLVEFNVAGASYLVVHPDYIEHILRDNESNYPHAPFLDARWAKIVGNGLVTSKGDFWARQRRLADPSFHQDRIEGFAKIMTETTEEMLEAWKPRIDRSEPIDVREEMMRLTITILSKAMFSADIWEKTDTISRVVSVLLTHASNRLFSPVDIPEQVPLPSNRRYVAARDEFDELIYGIIAERRSEPREDLLSMFLAAQDEETGEHMSDEQVRDEVRTMFIAGHETTATSLAWTWYLLSMFPDVAHRLRAELGEVLGGRSPTAADLPQLTYTWRVIQESLRLYPPIWMYLRTAIEDDVIDGYRIRAGKNIYLSPFITQRHLDFWPNPEGFDPDRFAPEKTQGWHRFKYWPFGGGPRKCIGNNFAVVEMQLVVATVAQLYDLVLVPGHQIVMQPGLSLRQRDGVLVNVRPAGSGSHARPAPEVETPVTTSA
jgi:cytochrome P450